MDSGAGRTHNHILPIRPGAVSDEDKQKLSEAGVIVVETEHPDDIKLVAITPPEVTTTQMLKCAITALSVEGDHNNKGGQQRLQFFHGIKKVILADDGDA